MNLKFGILLSLKYLETNLQMQALSYLEIKVTRRWEKERSGIQKEKPQDIVRDVGWCFVFLFLNEIFL